MRLRDIRQNLRDLREQTEDLLRGNEAVPMPSYDSGEVRNLHQLLCNVESDIRSDMVVILKHLEALVGAMVPKGPGKNFTWKRGDLN